MTAKTQAKAVARKTKAATPPAAAPVDFKPLHALIVADYKAVSAEGTAGDKATATLKALLLAIDYAAPGAVHGVLVDLLQVYGEHYPAKLAIRKTLVSNARKVVCGGIKDKHLVAGRGMTVLRNAVEKAANLNELRKAISEAKPEGLRESPKAASGTPKAAPASTAIKMPVFTGTLPTARPDAFAAAQKMLASLESFFKPSDSKALQAIEACIGMLRDQEIADRLKKAA